MLLHARHYRTGQLLELTLAAGRIVGIGPGTDDVAQVEGEYVAPAFVDVQINGGVGINFTSDRLTVDEVKSVVEVCHGHGIAVFCPTIITASPETICYALGTLARACESDPVLAEALPGFHLEGPYISPEDGPRGAHPREHVRL